MPNDRLLRNAPLLPALRKPLPADPVWKLQKGTSVIECALRSHGEYGWEVLLLRNGSQYYGRRWTMRAAALAEADERRQELERAGWT